MIKKHRLFYGLAIIAGLAAAALMLLLPGGDGIGPGNGGSAYIIDDAQRGKGTEPGSTGSELVDKITGAIPLEEFETTIEAVAGLPRDLKHNEIEALYDFIRHGENNTYNHAVKNDIINKLRNQHTPPTGLTELLLEVFYDKDQDRTVRLYALQHMRPWYRMQNQRDPRIREAFFDALKERDTEVAGVALLALRYLAKDQDDFEKEEIAKIALDIAKDPAENHLTRVSAIQVAAFLQGPTGNGGLYRQLAEEGDSLMVRMAAVAAMGQSGDRAHVEYLQELSQEQGPLQKPAQTALKKLEQ